MQVDIDKLNKEQREAVLHEEGPLLIVAGAGTGKTTVIAQRIARLVTDRKATTEEILAVTFTNKAAGEMEDRVERLLNTGYTDLWISTFHGFAQRVLEDNALDIGLPLDFSLLDQTDAWILIKQNLDKFNLNYYQPLGNPTKFIHALISHFSKCKDQGIYPADYLKYADELKTNLTDLNETTETERLKELSSAYHTYQKLLLDNNFLDFGDLINYCSLLFKKRPTILEKYRKRFKYILVDEFQDTNWAQFDLIKMLAVPTNNLTVCADDDQAIYRFRGASFSNIVQFKKDFPKAKEIFLVDNYRSCQNILDLSYNFIQANNPNRLEYISKINKKLIASSKEEAVIEHIHTASLTQETESVVNKITEIINKNKDNSYSDFAILVRANGHAVPFVRELERVGIPYQFLASKGLYSKPVILDVISYFKLLDDYHENSACYRVLNMPFLDISPKEIIQINFYSKKRTKSIYEAMQNVQSISGISENTKNKINFLLSLITKHTDLAQQNNVSEIFISFLRDSGYLKYLLDNGDDESTELLTQFYKKIKQFEDKTLNVTLNSFMESLNMEIESNEQGKLEFDASSGPDVVRIMTIHSAKGLEFKYVFLVNMVDKRFPSINRKDPIEIPEELIKDIVPEGDIHLQEERRLFYVAMTRAKKGLFFTSAYDYGGVRAKKLSKFLVDMGFKLETKDESKKEKISDYKTEIIINENEIVLPDHFSYSQLSIFDKCPKQYKFSHILKIPTKGKAMFSFGTTIHNTLYEFLKEQNLGEVTQDDLFGFGEQRSSNLTLKDIENIYSKKWVDEWYDNKAQKDNYYKLGKKILKQMYTKFEENPPNVLNINDQPALELSFALKIGDNLIRGRIDRIDQTEEGVRIIDYKTGQAKDKLDTDSKKQLLIYQIAAEEVLDLNPVEMAYHYVEEDKFLSFLGTEKEKQTQKEQIIKQIETMKQSDFSSTPGFHCKYCDFRNICNDAQK